MIMVQNTSKSGQIVQVFCQRTFESKKHQRFFEDFDYYLDRLGGKWNLKNDKTIKRSVLVFGMVAQNVKSYLTNQRN